MEKATKNNFHLTDFFYEHIENLKIKYQTLVLEDSDSELLDAVTEDISAMGYNVDIIRKQEIKNGIDMNERKNCVYLTEQSLYESFSAMDREGELVGLLREF